MASLLDDRAMAQRIFDHIEAKTTDLADEVWREPVANYRCEARLRRELEQVLRRWPSPFCPSASLPEPGAYLAREAAGTPLLAVRGSDDVVRVFRNVCRHRGMQVASGSGCAAAFSCRYHGWTYGLDGGLRHVPHAHGFPDLEPERRAGLVPVQAVERQGIVWVTQQPGDAAAQAALDDLPELLGKDLRVFAARETPVAANWKIFLEGFIEGYHIRSTHPESFYPFGYDNLNVVEYFGRNSRVTYPFRRIQKLAALPPEQRRVDGALTYVYQLFPNAIVAVLSHHTVLSVLEPVSVSETRLVSFAMGPAAQGGGAEADAAALRDSAFVNQTGAAEDAAMVQGIQKGLESGANESFVYGRFEGAITHFHRGMHAALGER
jgi:phenylpropionate dioxygenase-like ring-hydroxylating dioxygenase large terminal subunit